MEIRILHLAEGARQATGLTVIIDVFRAFTTEAMLIKNNAAKILPVRTAEEAFAYKKAHPQALLCGERGGVMIKGFDFGNSPSQIEPLDLTGKTVVHTTSAGTQGIANASQAEEILGGSLVCAEAIAAYIRQKNPAVVSLVCMGLAGERTTEEDVLCGEYIRNLLENRPLPDFAARLERLQYTDGAKFFDPAQQSVFPRRDFELCVEVNSCPFVLRLTNDADGLSCMERVDIPMK